MLIEKKILSTKPEKWERETLRETLQDWQVNGCEFRKRKTCCDRSSHSLTKKLKASQVSWPHFEVKVVRWKSSPQWEHPIYNGYYPMDALDSSESRISVGCQARIVWYNLYQTAENFSKKKSGIVYESAKFFNLKNEMNGSFYLALICFGAAPVAKEREREERKCRPENEVSS